jgi:hypothetical protein
MKVGGNEKAREYFSEFRKDGFMQNNSRDLQTK